MSQITDKFTVCDFCGGAIPVNADRIQGVNGTLVIASNATGFANMDFCCTAHMGAWVAAQPAVATPNPVYPPPPA